MQKLSDADLESFLKVLGHFCMSGLEDVVAFDSKTDSEREEVAKISLKSCETVAMVALGLIKEDSLDLAKIKKLESLIGEGRYDEVRATFQP